MLQGHQVEELICLVAAMDRNAIARRIREFRGSFPVDFTPHFVETTDLDRLRHIYLAMCLQTHQMPEIDTDESDVLAERVA